mgnify:CR=1 FL=1
MSNFLKDKLSISELKKRAEEIASQDLLSMISGGIMDSCHVRPKEDAPVIKCDNI